jgi:hypothetical protein
MGQRALGFLIISNQWSQVGSTRTRLPVAALALATYVYNNSDISQGGEFVSGNLRAAHGMLPH